MTSRFRKNFLDYVHIPIGLLLMWLAGLIFFSDTSTRELLYTLVALVVVITITYVVIVALTTLLDYIFDSE